VARDAQLYIGGGEAFFTPAAASALLKDLM
jgi:hypothetical protein